MSDINLVVMSGTVGRSPEVRTTGSGLEVGTVSIEVTETWTAGERKEFVRVVGWKELADTIKRLAIGDRILVQGRWSSRSWEDKNGNKQRTTEVSARSIDHITGSGVPSTEGTDVRDIPDDFTF